MALETQQNYSFRCKNEGMNSFNKMRNKLFLVVVPKKYIFLIGAVLFLIGSVLGMSKNVDIFTTILFAYTYSIVLYICINGSNERRFKSILLISTCTIIISIGINNILGGVYIMILYGVLWFAYRSIGKYSITEDMIENGSVMRIFYSKVDTRTLILQIILLLIYAFLYVKLNVGVANSISI